MANVIHQAPQEFIVLSGDDAVTLPLMALGGRGVISVASNEIPAEMTQLAKLCLAGDFASARALQHKYLPLMEINFIESNPIPVKAALGLMGPHRKGAGIGRPVGESARCRLRSSASSTRRPKPTRRSISGCSTSSRTRSTTAAFAPPSPIH